MGVPEEVQRLLTSIGAGYGFFLEDERLSDTFLARMTYFWTVRKSYLSNPVEENEIQMKVLDRLDEWIAETQKAMRAAMPPPVQSMTLAVVTKKGLEI